MNNKALEQAEKNLLALKQRHMMLERGVDRSRFEIEDERLLIETLDCLVEAIRKLEREVKYASVGLPDLGL